jgi:hypothetical protein
LSDRLPAFNMSCSHYTIREKFPKVALALRFSVYFFDEFVFSCHIALDVLREPTTLISLTIALSYAEWTAAQRQAMFRANL